MDNVTHPRPETSALSTASIAVTGDDLSAGLYVGEEATLHKDEALWTGGLTLDCGRAVMAELDEMVTVCEVQLQPGNWQTRHSKLALNPLKFSGVRWCYLKVFNAIQV